MKTIGGKQFPTVWSDLVVKIKSLEELDTNTSLSIACITDWLEKYHNLGSDISNGDVIDEVYREGIELLSYLSSLTSRVSGIYSQYKVLTDAWASGMKASFPGEKLSETARDRMILVEPDFIEFSNRLIVLAEDKQWCMNQWISLKEALVQLNLRLRRLGSEQSVIMRGYNETK